MKNKMFWCIQNIKHYGLSKCSKEIWNYSIAYKQNHLVRKPIIFLFLVENSSTSIQPWCASTFLKSPPTELLRTLIKINAELHDPGPSATEVSGLSISFLTWGQWIWEGPGGAHGWSSERGTQCPKTVCQVLTIISRERWSTISSGSSKECVPARWEMSSSETVQSEPHFQESGWRCSDATVLSWLNERGSNPESPPESLLMLAPRKWTENRCELRRRKDGSRTEGRMSCQRLALPECTD